MNESVLYVGLRRPRLEWEAEIEAATEQGYVVRVVSDGDLRHTGLPQGRLGQFEPGRSDAETAASIVEELRRSGDLPSAVFCWGDRTVGTTALVCAELGLRGPGTDAARICLDKTSQRRVLEPLGLNPRWCSGSTIEDLRATVDRSQVRQVFKLAHSSGGRGMALIDEDTDLDALLKATSLNYVDSDAFLVEEFVEGSEHSATGIVCGGEVTVIAVSDKTLIEGTFVTTTTVVPSRLPSEQSLQLTRAAEQAVRAVGLRDGGFHVDMRMTGTGPVVLEIGARLGGDLINSHLVPLATGGRLRPYTALVDVLTRGRSPEPVPFTRNAAMFVLPIEDRPAGHVLDRLRTHDRVFAAADWSTTDLPAVAAVTAVEDASSPMAVREELLAWITR